MAETMVRMGELAASAVAGDVLVSLGLGSCIGLALLDRRHGVGGLAHVVLPASGAGAPARSWKFADFAVPELIERMVALGARKPMLEAALVGGASMFTVSKSTLEVGQRNEAAVRDQLAAHRINVIACETGGDRGRTIRVHVGANRVTVREAGGVESELVTPVVRA
jgi:chemotaxis protein CheD